MIRRLFAALGPDHERRLRRLLGLFTLAAVLQGLGFVLLVPVLQELLGQRPSGAWPWVIAMAVLWLAYAAVNYPATLAGDRVGTRLSRELHHRIGDKLAGLPLAWFNGDRVGEVGRLVTKRVMDIMSVPSHLLRPLIDTAVTPLVVVAAMLWFDWRMALAMATAAVIALLVYRWASNGMRAADRETGHVHAAAAGRIVEFARAQPVLRAFGSTVRGHADLDEALVAQHFAGRRMLRAGMPGVIGLGFVAQAAFIALLALSTYLALGGGLGTPELIALLVLAARFVEPVMGAAELGGAVRTADNALGEIKTLLDTPTLPEPERSRRPDGPDIALDNVTFGYGDSIVLDGLSLAVPRGRMTALVGPSGAGKTTVIKLIARFFDPGDGVVTVGGVDIRDIRTEDLMARLSVVFQDVYLFDGTIMDNIRIGRPDASDDEIRAAARTARVDGIAERLPGGWDAQVGEGGGRLSGGERQRISIARALLKNTPVVLFDEATAALDAENEDALRQAMSALAADRTVLVIAHRLHTLREADHIVFLEQGRVSEQGTHEELLARDGRYAHHWHARQRAQGWRLTREVESESLAGTV